MRLTDNERALLEKLAAGDEIWAGMGHIRLCKADEPARIADVAYLLTSGMLSANRDPQTFIRYSITEAGRRALAEGE